jgi:hypothetical protein
LRRLRTVVAVWRARCFSGDRGCPRWGQPIAGRPLLCLGCPTGVDASLDLLHRKWNTSRPSEFLDLVTLREVTYSRHGLLIIAPYLLSRDPQVRVWRFGERRPHRDLSLLCPRSSASAVRSFYLMRLMYRKPPRNMPPVPAANRRLRRQSRAPIRPRITENLLDAN